MVGHKGSPYMDSNSLCYNGIMAETTFISLLYLLLKIQKSLHFYWSRTCHLFYHSVYVLVGENKEPISTQATTE